MRNFFRKKKEDKTSSSKPSSKNTKSTTTPKPTLTKIGNETPICPYCQSVLPKMYPRKTACPNCEKPIYKRTRPLDGKNILIREDQIDEIEQQWWVKNGIFEEMMTEKIAEESRYLSVKEDLKEKWGIDPPDNDVKWSILMEDTLSHGKNYNWGFYRNTRFEMANLLLSENKHSRAITFLCEVLYLDLNGPNNVGSRDPDILKSYPAFDTNFSFVAPGVIKLIIKTAKSENIPLEKIRDEFLSIAEKIHKNVRTPLDPKLAWKRIEKELI